LHARFAVYWTSDKTRQDPKDLRIFLSPEGAPFKNSKVETQNIFRQSIEETIKAINALGSTPVIVGPVPNPGVDVVKCLSRPVFRSLETALKYCDGFTQEQTLSRSAEV